MAQCQFCLLEITDKRNLRKHQQTKKCLKIQNEKKTDVLEVKQLKTTIDKLIKDNDSKEQCIQNLNNQIHKLEKTNDVLLQKATSKTNKTTNNTINITMPSSCLDLSEERLNPIFSNYFSINILKDICNKLPTFLIERILKDVNGNLTYISTDKDRKQFRFRDDEKGIIYDPNARVLTQTILNMGKPYIEYFLNMKYEINEEDVLDDLELKAIEHRQKKDVKNMLKNSNNNSNRKYLK